MASQKKILIIVSDADSFPIKKGDEVQQQPSGFFLMELAKPLSTLLNEGYEVTFASPKGHSPQPDPNSESLVAFVGNFYERRREQDLIARMRRENGLDSPRPFKTISDDELAAFAGIFIPGGHAPLADLGADPELGRILWHFHARHKPTAVICHGPYALLSTQYAAPEGTTGTGTGTGAGAGAGEFAYKGYKITSWSDAEEKMMETMWGGEVPKTEGELSAAGAQMVVGMGEKVGAITVDRELVSGGNPMAAQSLGEKFVEMMKTGV